MKPLRWNSTLPEVRFSWTTLTEGALLQISVRDDGRRLFGTNDVAA
jgi:hypothetical protein